MLIYKSNIQLDIKDEEFEKYQKEGFKKLGVETNSNETTKNKSIAKMKVDELKELALKIGIENVDALTKDELIAVIKGSQNG